VRVDSAGTKTFELKGATDIYWDITSVVQWAQTDDSKCTTTSPIIVTNTSGEGKIISITKLKWSYAAPTAAGANTMSFSFAPQGLVAAKAVAQSIQSGAAPQADPIPPQFPQPGTSNGRRMLTLQTLIEMIFGRLFEALRVAFIRK
ncbi:MAG: hypothetical protein IKD72_02145, partial [Clostridia bacterium]|nr:hypothetical protein [Clostridia bacterium]